MGLVRRSSWNEALGCSSPARLSAAGRLSVTQVVPFLETMPGRACVDPSLES